MLRTVLLARDNAFRTASSTPFGEELRLDLVAHGTQSYLQR